MKTHTSTTLRNLIVNELDPSKAKMTRPQISKWLKELPEINQDLYTLMSILVFSPASDELVNRHIRQIQRESIHLLNVLEGYHDVSSKMKPLHDEVSCCLQGILLHIKSDYDDFFNLDLAIPNSHYLLEALEIEARINPMISALKNKNVDKDLQRLIQSSLNDFIKAGSCTYYRLAYMKGLQESLSSLCNIAEKEEINERIKEHLFHHNLNTAAHFGYYKKEIQHQLGETFDVLEQQQLLYAYQKQFKGWSQQKTSGFSPKNEGIKTSVLSFIAAEIKYLAKKLKDGQVVPAAGTAQWRSEQDRYRVPVSFSVDALAYFFKLLTRAGVINGGVKTQLLFFISKNFQTPGIGAGFLSVNSLESKYRQVVQRTADAVRVALVRMLKVLDEEFA